MMVSEREREREREREKEAEESNEPSYGNLLSKSRSERVESMALNPFKQPSFDFRCKVGYMSSRRWGTLGRYRFRKRERAMIRYVRGRESVCLHVCVRERETERERVRSRNPLCRRFPPSSGRTRSWTRLASPAQSRTHLTPERSSLVRFLFSNRTSFFLKNWKWRPNFE